MDRTECAPGCGCGWSDLVWLFCLSGVSGVFLGLLVVAATGAGVVLVIVRLIVVVVMIRGDVFCLV